MTLDFSYYGGPSDEWLEFEKTLPPAATDLTGDLPGMKAAFNGQREKRTAAAMVELKPLVHMVDYSIPTRDGSTIEARTYRSVKQEGTAKLPVLVYLHGGGYIFGSLDGEDATCSQIAINTGVLALNCNYRHTPEHIFPTAWNDSQDAIAWLFKNIDLVGGDASRVIVAGASAGGQLTASLVLEKHLGKSEVLKNLPDLAGQILMTPILAYPGHYEQGPGKQLKNSSYIINKDAPILGKKSVESMFELLKMGDVDLKDTKVNQVNATADEVKGLPPTVVSVAGMDLLRDEGLLYGKLLSEANVPTQTWLFKGMPHAHRRFGPALKASAHFDQCLYEGIKWILSKPTATGKFDVTIP